MARLGAGEVRHMNRDGRPGERPFPLAPCLAGLSLVVSGPVFLMAYVALLVGGGTGIGDVPWLLHMAVASEACGIPLVAYAAAWAVRHKLLA